MRSSGLFFLLLVVLCTVVSSSAFYVRRVPVVYKRIPHTSAAYIFESPVLSPVLWRSRRSQPVGGDYETDEFSADPFEMALMKGRLPPGVLG